MDEEEVAICDTHDHRDQARRHDLDRGDDTDDRSYIFDGEICRESDTDFCYYATHCMLPYRDLYDATEYYTLTPYLSYEVGIWALALAMTKWDDRYVHASQYKLKVKS